jgi:hypothetical protein
MSITESLHQAVEAIPEGQPFVPAQFLTLASRASVDQALSRMRKAGRISRVSRGVYVRSKKSRYVGEVLPGPQAVAEALAKAEGAKIQLHGAEAARQLGLTTQVPTQPTYYTSGRSRQIRLGQMRLRLKHVSSRKLMLAERPGGLALAALRHLGKSNVTPEVIQRVREKLPAKEFKALQAASLAMPAWLAEALNSRTRTRA